MNLRIKNTRSRTEIEEKRFYPPFKMTADCPHCGKTVEFGDRRRRPPGREGGDVSDVSDCVVCDAPAYTDTAAVFCMDHDRDDIHALRARVAELEALLNQRIDMAYATGRRYGVLEGALLRYGRHEGPCLAGFDGEIGRRHPCTCGLDAALKEPA